jgi:2-polyprenyl-3-methyl-5-hydroxy-6-metoxy-1,4-benzoquinol methylase
LTEQDAPDTEHLMAEIEVEVRRARASGVLPHGFEQDLDRMFAELSPAGATGEGFSEILRKAEEYSYVDPVAPLASNLPGGSAAKSAIRRLVLWNLDWIARQVSAFDHTAVVAIRLLHERLERLEKDRPAHPPETAVRRTPPDVTEWADLVAHAVQETPGRVLHAECGDGTLVAILARQGLDVYGVDPRADLVLPAADAGLDVRPDEVEDHLSVIGDGELGAVVLTGVVDLVPLTRQLALADRVARAVAPGGRVLILSVDPRTWLAEGPPVEVDLAPGRPLRAETWQYLLEQRGLGFVELRRHSEEAAGAVGTGSYALVMARPH